MSDTAVAMLVPNEMMSASANHQKSALEMVSQNSAGSPTWLKSAKTAISVPTAMSRFVALTRASCWSGGASTPAASHTASRTSPSSFLKSDRARRPIGRMS